MRSIRQSDIEAARLVIDLAEILHKPVDGFTTRLAAHKLTPNGGPDSSAEQEVASHGESESNAGLHGSTR